MIDILEQVFPNSQYRQIYLKDDPRAERNGMSHKAPIDSNIYTYNDIKDCANRIGWIVPTGYTVVDIDNKANAKRIQKLLMGEDVETIIFETEHGCHFIFKSIAGVFQTQNCFCRLGIKIDTRSNASGYIIIPYNDPDRRVVSTTKTIPSLPQYLLPEKLDFPVMDLVEKGERNGKLFELMTKLKMAKNINIDQIKECVSLCNRYILSEPIPQQELDKTVLCAKNLERGVDASKISSNTIAIELLQDVRIITTTQGMYMYNGKYYEPCDDTQLARYIHAKYAEFGRAKRDEVIEFIKLKTYIKQEEVNSDWRKITLRNGVLNLMSGEITDFNPDEVMTRYVDIEFIPDCPVSERIENFLNGLSGYTLGIPETQQIHALEKKTKLLEFLGYCLVSRNKFQKVFFLYGPAHTGKSTFLRITQKLLGANNCAALSMSDLENAFMPSQLQDKMVNIGDDVSGNDLLDGATLKILCGNLPIMVQQKYEKPYAFVNEAKFIFSCNKMPLFKDKTDGLYRRLEILEITNKVAMTTRRTDFEDTFTHEDMQYLLLQAFLAINNALINDRLTSSVCCEEALEKFRTHSSTVLSFAKSKGEVSPSNMRKKLTELGCKEDFENRSANSKYSEYISWCYDNGKNRQSFENFVDAICAEFDFVIKRGCFVKNEF